PGASISLDQASTAAPAQASPNEGSMQPSPASIQVSGPTASSPPASPLRIDYTTDSTASTSSPGSTVEHSTVLTSQTSRKVARKHRLVRESLIRRIASERVFHKRSTEHHHGGK